MNVFANHPWKIAYVTAAAILTAAVHLSKGAF